MPWFTRRHRDEPDPSGPRDAVLPGLSVDQAAALTRIVRERLAARGREGAVRTGALHLDDGTVFGLHNLATRLVDVRYRDWPGAVDTHLDTLFAATTAKVTSPAPPSSVLARLWSRDDVPAAIEYDVREPLPGIVALLAVDRPDVVVDLFGDDLAEVGGHVEAAYRLAEENLADLPLPQHSSLNADPDDPSAVVHVFASDDFFGASRLLVLPQLLRRALDTTIPPHGVLVVVPNRHLLAVHVPTGRSVIPATQLMANLAVGECSSRPGPVSPLVYHVCPDLRATAFSEVEADGTVGLHVVGPVEDMFRGLGLLDEG